MSHPLSMPCVIISGEDWVKNEVGWTGKPEMRKAGFLAVGEACKAIFWRTPGLKEGTFESSKVSSEGTLISASTIPSHKWSWPSPIIAHNRRSHLGTTDDFTSSFLHFSLFSTALWGSANSRPVHSLMLSSHLVLCLPCLLPPFTVRCKMALTRPVEWETWPYHCSLRPCPYHLHVSHKW